MSIIAHIGIAGIVMLAIMVFGQLTGGVGLAVLGVLGASKDTRQDSSAELNAGALGAKTKGSPWLILAALGVLLVILAFSYGQ
jgi:hypothetical protein